MKYYAVNGSPRKNKNTATLLQAALEGVKTAQVRDVVETEMLHLYDLDFQSCLSCFACKRIGGKSYGKCAIRDSLTPILQKLSEADGIIFGSPIYYGNITGKMKSFFERLLFPYTVYDACYSSLAPRRMPTAFIYSMNVTETVMEEWEYQKNLKDIEFFIGNVFSAPEIVYAWNTYQFDDYSKYKAECFSEEEKAAYRDRQFPLDCRKAAATGKLIAEKAFAVSASQEIRRSFEHENGIDSD